MHISYKRSQCVQDAATYKVRVPKRMCCFDVHVKCFVLHVLQLLPFTFMRRDVHCNQQKLDQTLLGLVMIIESACMLFL